MFDLNTTHGFQKIEGLHCLERPQVIFEEEFINGDKVAIFSMPDGKFLLARDEEGIEIEKITSSYIRFKTEIVIEEK